MSETTVIETSPDQLQAQLDVANRRVMNLERECAYIEALLVEVMNEHYTADNNGRFVGYPDNLVSKINRQLGLT